MKNTVLTLTALAVFSLSAPTMGQETENSMAELALFLTIKTQPGQRDAVVALWEKHLKSRAADNAVQTHYVFALDLTDPDTIRITEVYSDKAAFEANSSAPWFSEYMAEAGPLLAGEPGFAIGLPYWVK